MCPFGEKESTVCVIPASRRSHTSHPVCFSCLFSCVDHGEKIQVVVLEVDHYPSRCRQHQKLRVPAFLTL